MGRLGKVLVQVALVGGEDDGAGVGAADGEELALVRVAAERGLDVEALRAEHVVLEAVHGTQALDAVGAALIGVVPELRGGAEHEVRGGVGVDGVVLAHGVEARRVAAEGERGDAVGPEGVRAGLERRGEGRLDRLAAGPDAARVPELDAGVGLGGREQEVLAAGGEPLDGRDGRRRRDARDGALVHVVQGVDGARRVGVQVEVARGGGARPVLHGARGAAEVPDLDPAGAVRRCDDVAVAGAGLEGDLAERVVVAVLQLGGDGQGRDVDDAGGAVATAGGESLVVLGE